MEQVLALWPSKAKNPAAAVRQSLREPEHNGRTIIFTDDKTIVPINLALQGIQFRVSLSRQELKQGVLFFAPNFIGFLPGNVKPEDVKLFDASGQPLQTKVVAFSEERQSAFGAYTQTEYGFELDHWFKLRRVKKNDCILITIQNWQAREFRLAPESSKYYRKKRSEIEDRNQALMDLLFEMLENSRNEMLYSAQSILTAYARHPIVLSDEALRLAKAGDKGAAKKWLGRGTNRLAERGGPADTLVVAALAARAVGDTTRAKALSDAARKDPDLPALAKKQLTP
ncbi:MAG: hypothetical protein AAF721_31335 [Myxococcota bacterium]